MENKVAFAKFIAQKRNEAGFTQKELAARLFVSDTAVSKWERGLSYPDITLITKICEELTITEHEFITACDDFEARKEKQQAKRYRGFVKAYQWTMYLSYAIALLTCLICNLAINHTLSWFFVVLSSVMLAFSVTNLPLLLKKQKTLITFSAATVLIYLLLFICCWYVGGNWLLSVAYPIATVSLLFAWLTMLTIRFLKVNWQLKTGIVLLLLGVITIIMNPFCGYLLGVPTPPISAYLNFSDWQLTLIGSKITFWCLSVFGILGVAWGIAVNARTS